MTLCNCFSFSFSPSRQDFGRTGNFFSRMFYLLLLLTRVNLCSLNILANSFVELPSIVISGACGQEPQQVRGAEHASESCWASYSTSLLNSVWDLLTSSKNLLLKFIDNHFVIAIIRIIYIYLHVIFAYICFYIYLLIFFQQPW